MAASWIIIRTCIIANMVAVVLAASSTVYSMVDNELYSDILDCKGNYFLSLMSSPLLKAILSSRTYSCHFNLTNKARMGPGHRHQHDHVTNYLQHVGNWLMQTHLNCTGHLLMSNTNPTDFESTWPSVSLYCTNTFSTLTELFLHTSAFTKCPLIAKLISSRPLIFQLHWDSSITKCLPQLTQNSF